MLWIGIAVGAGVACVIAVAVVMHVWLNRLNGYLRESVQAALERQRDNQQKLADGLQRLDGDLSDMNRRLRALEAGQAASESPPRGGGATEPETGDGDGEPDDVPGGKPRRFLH